MLSFNFEAGQPLQEARPGVESPSRLEVSRYPQEASPSLLEASRYRPEGQQDLLVLFPQAVPWVRLVAALQAAGSQPVPSVGPPREPC